MPDLVFRRDGTHPPVKNACMYCGRPATHTDARTFTNPRLEPPAGSRYEIPRGGDDAGCFAVVFLPMLFANVVMDARDGFRHREALRNAPPLVPPDTIVAVTTCDRHRRYGRRFVWGAVVWFVLLVVTWAAAVILRHQPGGAPLWLFAVAIVVTIACPLIFVLLWNSDGPVRVAHVGRDTVTLTRVREAYFDAPG